VDLPQFVDASDSDRHDVLQSMKPITE